MPTMFDGLSIFVADMARSLAFYRSLGLDIPADADSQPHVDHQLPSGFSLMWDTHETVRSYDRAFSPQAGAGGWGGLELAFRCDDPSAVDKLYRAVTESGHPGHLAPFDAFWGQRYAVVVDPDGNKVALYANQPDEDVANQAG